MSGPRPDPEPNEMCRLVIRQGLDGPKEYFRSEGRRYKEHCRSPYQVPGPGSSSQPSLYLRSCKCKIEINRVQRPQEDRQSAHLRGDETVGSSQLLDTFYSFPSHGQSNPTTCNHILEGIITKYIKKLLKLPRSATKGHNLPPISDKIPSLGSVKMRAKLSLLASLDRPTDHAVMDTDKC